MNKTNSHKTVSAGRIKVELDYELTLRDCLDCIAELDDEKFKRALLDLVESRQVPEASESYMNWLSGIEGAIVHRPSATSLAKCVRDDLVRALPIDRAPDFDDVLPDCYVSSDTEEQFKLYMEDGRLKFEVSDPSVTHTHICEVVHLDIQVR